MYYFSDVVGDAGWGFPTVHGSPYPFITPLTQVYRWTRPSEETSESWRGGGSTNLRVWLVGTRHENAEFLYIITHTVKGVAGPDNSGEVFSRPILAGEFTQQLALKRENGEPMYERLFKDDVWLAGLSTVIRKAWKDFDDDLEARGGVKLIDTRAEGFVVRHNLTDVMGTQQSRAVSGFPDSGGLEPMLSLWWLPSEHRMETVWSRNGDRVVPVRLQYKSIEARTELPAAYVSVLFKDSLFLPVRKTRIQDDRFLDGFLNTYAPISRRGHSDGDAGGNLVLDLSTAGAALEGLGKLKWRILERMSSCVFHGRNLVMGLLSRDVSGPSTGYMIHALKNGKYLSYDLPSSLRATRMLENDLKLNRSSAAVAKLLVGDFEAIAEDPGGPVVKEAVECLKIQGTLEVIDG